MPSSEDTRYSGLKTSTGANGSISDLEMIYLAGKGFGTKSLSDRRISDHGKPNPTSAGGVLPNKATLAAALNNRNNAPLRGVVIGDSVFEGQGAATKGARFFDRLHTRMRAQYPTTGLAGGGSLDCIIPGYRKIGGASSPWTNSNISGTTGTNSTFDFGPYGRRTRELSVAATTTFTFNGTSCNIKFGNDATTATLFTYRVDGGSIINVNSDGSGNTYTGSVNILTGAAIDSAHSVVITAVKLCDIHALEVFNGDEAKGIRFYDWCGSGVTTAQHNSDLVEKGKILLAYNPHVVILEVGANDPDATTMKTNLQGVINWVKANTTTTPSIIIAGIFSNKVNWSTWVTAFQQLADADPNNVSFLDMSLYMPTWVTGQPADANYDIQGEAKDPMQDLMAQLMTTFMTVV